ncbi:MAG TPA: SRPBCC family protein [Vicinamibacteria bacterium]|jgi:ligand-binding SRPBCC domain-containing protein
MAQSLEFEVTVPRRAAEVFPFFADARNLERLTPPWLRFEIVTREPIPMHAGAFIDYRLRWHGIPLRWTSRITEWEPPRRFVDEQVRGPYRMWRHEHLFEEVDGGTRVRDRVLYAVFAPDVVERLFVRRDVERIFAYRQERLRELFDGSREDTAPKNRSISLSTRSG